MKVTIEIPSYYYEGVWEDQDGNTTPASENKSQEIIYAAETDWKDFAFEMADLISSKLQIMSDQFTPVESSK